MQRIRTDRSSIGTAKRSASLIASIHDVGPRFESPVDRLIEVMARHVGEHRFAMLVVPDHWGEAPIRPGTPFASRLRGWADAGIEIFLHGWFHRDDSAHAGSAARWKAKHMTAGEGEFLGLDRSEATRRLRDGRALLEDIIGRPVTGFVAPAWLYGDGALEALAELEFPLAEDHLKVWRPVDGAVLARSPVITWASRSAPRRASSRMVAAAARWAMPRHHAMRVAVHPGDAGVPALMSSIEATLAALSRNASIMRYADLLPEAAPMAEAA